MDYIQFEKCKPTKDVFFIQKSRLNVLECPPKYTNEYCEAIIVIGN